MAQRLDFVLDWHHRRMLAFLGFGEIEIAIANAKCWLFDEFHEILGSSKWICAIYIHSPSVYPTDKSRNNNNALKKYNQIMNDKYPIKTDDDILNSHTLHGYYDSNPEQLTHGHSYFLSGYHT